MPTPREEIEILIAEDSPTQAQKLAYLLEGMRYRVTATANGVEALAAARRRKPTLVISDVLMPEMNGFELCRGIKADAALRDVPVILVTTLADPHDVILGLESGADLFVRKPYEDRYLLSRIDYVVMNLELRQHRNVQIGMEITLAGERHFINAERQQILDLLISTYEQAIEINNELKQRERALHEEKERAEAANRAKGDFLAFMSHEIRTPMNGILGMLELLSMTRLDAQQREAVDVVLHSGRSLQGIIDDVLDFSKIESGRMELHPQAHSLPAILEATRTLFSGAASTRKLAIKLDCDARLAPAHSLDAIRLRQVLNNLIGNALKFTASGHVRLSAEVASQESAAQAVRFAVEDTGAGISEADQRRLFESFAQVDKDPARAAAGTGLGLAICKRLVELMGGAIELDSAPGKGSTFAFTLRLPVVEPPPRTEERTAPASTPAGVAGDRDGVRVLVVDDHPVNRLVLERQVAALGYGVDTACDAEEAMSKWKAGGFGVVITDCNMPDADGFELVRRIRAIERHGAGARTPVIACTANAQKEAADECAAAGMDDYIAKPVALAQLREKLARWAGAGGAAKGDSNP